jgi:hypothetical protein
MSEATCNTGWAVFDIEEHGAGEGGEEKLYVRPSEVVAITTEHGDSSHCILHFLCNSYRVRATADEVRETLDDAADGGGVMYARKAVAAFDAAYGYLDVQWPSTGPAPKGVKYATEGVCDAARLARACIAATQCLATLGPWDVQALTELLDAVRIFVKGSPTFIDARRRSVAGEAFADRQLIVIGSDFAALCHELAELAYTNATGGSDWQATEWAGRDAVSAAVAAYVKEMENARERERGHTMMTPQGQARTSATIQAVKVVNAIVADLQDRRGLGQEWDQIDDEIKDEIRAVWIRLVQRLALKQEAKR